MTAAGVITAERLLEAAAKARSIAEAATPGPWWVHDGNDHDVWFGDQEAVRRVDRGGVSEIEADEILSASMSLANADIGSEEDAAHVALWDPRVALAVADWLDLMAKDYAPYWAEPYAAPFVPVIELAYRVAGLLLGDEA